MWYGEYMKKVFVLLFIVLIGIAVFAYVKNRNASVPEPIQEEVPVSQPAEPQNVNISEEAVKEQNFTGKRPVFAGTGSLVSLSGQYVDQYFADFKKTADAEVPEMIKEFGPDSSAGKYSLELEANLVIGKDTTSVVMSGYDYRGGANGNSFYKAITVSNETGEQIQITDLIKQEKQQEFVAFVKNKILTEWKDRGIFPEAVQMVTMELLSNWSMDENGALTIYFDKYAVGAGAMGATKLVIPAVDLQKYM